MNKHKVEFAAPAVSAYQFLAAHSGAKSGSKSELLSSLDEIIDDVLTFKPFDSGSELGGLFAGLYWISQGTLHIFYEASPRPRTVVIVFIWDGPNFEAHVRKADILCAEILRSGKLQEMVTRPAAAN